jgi:hypothetical protein
MQISLVFNPVIAKCSAIGCIMIANGFIRDLHAEDKKQKVLKTKYFKVCTIFQINAVSCQTEVIKARSNYDSLNKTCLTDNKKLNSHFMALNQNNIYLFCFYFIVKCLVFHCLEII